jgi:3-hydroxybutyryl-CoA dehydrogenase
VEVADSHGFVVNRVLFRVIAESCALVESGVASVGGIDAAMKAGANFPMGPFELVDLIGLDTSSEILRSLADRLSDDTCRRAAGFLKTVIEKGHLGRKSGRGFYEYSQKR